MFKNLLLHALVIYLTKASQIIFKALQKQRFIYSLLDSASANSNYP